MVTDLRAFVVEALASLMFWFALIAGALILLGALPVGPLIPDAVCQAGCLWSAALTIFIVRDDSRDKRWRWLALPLLLMIAPYLFR